MNEDRKTFEGKVDAQLVAWQRDLELLRIQAARGGARLREDYQSALDALDERCRAAAERINQLKAATDEAWESVKAGSEQTWAELRNGFDQTWQEVRAAYQRHASPD